MKRLTEAFDFDNENQIDNEFEDNVKNLSFFARFKEFLRTGNYERQGSVAVYPVKTLEDFDNIIKILPLLTVNGLKECTPKGTDLRDFPIRNIKFQFHAPSEFRLYEDKFQDFIDSYIKRFNMTANEVIKREAGKPDSTLDTYLPSSTFISLQCMIDLVVPYYGSKENKLYSLAKLEELLAYNLKPLQNTCEITIYREFARGLMNPALFCLFRSYTPTFDKGDAKYEMHQDLKDLIKYDANQPTVSFKEFNDLLKKGKYLIKIGYQYDFEKKKPNLSEAFSFDDEDEEESIDSLGRDSVQRVKKNKFMDYFYETFKEGIEYDRYVPISIEMPISIVHEVLPEIYEFLKKEDKKEDIPHINIIFGENTPNSLIEIQKYNIDLNKTSARSQLTNLCDTIEQVYKKYIKGKLPVLFDFWPLINFQFSDINLFKFEARSLGFLSLFIHWCYFNNKYVPSNFSNGKYSSTSENYAVNLNGYNRMLKTIYEGLTREERMNFQVEFTEGYQEAYDMVFDF